MLRECVGGVGGAGGVMTCACVGAACGVNVGVCGVADEGVHVFGPIWKGWAVVIDVLLIIPPTCVQGRHHRPPMASSATLPHPWPPPT